MTSIYQQVMGAEFERLHAQIQKRFSICSSDHVASIGTGVMHEVWRGKFFTLPFLYVGAWRNIMFPVQGKDVPFSIENYAYLDRYGRETVTWNRTFKFPNRERRFDATMVRSVERNCIVDYLGTHQHLAVDIHISAAENGGIRLHSGKQRFYEGAVAFRFPMIFSGIADVCEWYDDETNQFQIKVVVSNAIWGRLFGYRGSFDVTYVPVPEVPVSAKPLREEKRE